MYKRMISWKQIDGLLEYSSKILQEVMQPPIDYRGIIPIPRGGLVPAAILSYSMDLPILQMNWSVDTGYGMIIVDDICDTGSSFCRMKHFYPSATYVSLYAKPQGIRQVPGLIYSEEVPHGTWVVFPWAPDDEINR